MPLCKNGHQSDDPAYCSVCGIAIGPELALSGAGSVETAGVCPQCGTPRAQPNARFCEVCRYDFTNPQASSVTATNEAHPDPPLPVMGAPTAPTAAGPEGGPSIGGEPAPAAPPPTAQASGGRRYEVRVVQDPSLDTDPDPALPCPNDPEQRYPLDLSEMLIGRRDERRGIFPEIPLLDPAVSHRHANLLRLPDGSIAVRDLASTNGTFVNGNEIPPGVPFVLQRGDVVTLGRWTKLSVEAK